MMNPRKLALAISLAAAFGLLNHASAQAPAPTAVGPSAPKVAPPAPAKPPGPIPRLADGKPNMSGLFSGSFGSSDPTLRAEKIAFKPEYEAKSKQFIARNLKDEPTARCLSAGPIRLNTVPFFPVQFVQIPGQLVALYEWDHFFRVIPTDGRKQVEDPDPLQSLGHSVGKWEGDTLVVDIVGLSDYTWIEQNGGIHSDALHIVERYTMLDSDSIRYEAVADDSKAWTKPWKAGGTILKRRPATDKIMEYNCAENNKPEDYPSEKELLR